MSFDRKRGRTWVFYLFMTVAAASLVISPCGHKMEAEIWWTRGSGFQKSFGWENDILMKNDTLWHIFYLTLPDELNSQTDLCVLHRVRPFVCVLPRRWWSLGRVSSPVCLPHHLIDRLTDWLAGWRRHHGARYQTRRDQARQPSPLPRLTSHIVTGGLGDTDVTERRWPLCLTSCRLTEGSKSETAENQKSGFYLMNVSVMVRGWLGGSNESAETGVTLLSSVSAAVVALNLDFFLTRSGGMVTTAALVKQVSASVNHVGVGLRFPPAHTHTCSDCGVSKTSWFESGLEARVKVAWIWFSL